MRIRSVTVKHFHHKSVALSHEILDLVFRVKGFASKIINNGDTKRTLKILLCVDIFLKSIGN